MSLLKLSPSIFTTCCDLRYHTVFIIVVPFYRGSTAGENDVNLNLIFCRNYFPFRKVYHNFAFAGP